MAVKIFYLYLCIILITTRFIFSNVKYICKFIVKIKKSIINGVTLNIMKTIRDFMSDL